MHEDAERFSKFNFLLNWGEMFDHPPVKAFLLKARSEFRVVYRIGAGPVVGANVSGDGLRKAIRGFLQWMKTMRGLA